MTYDLVVIGGGIMGTPAAVWAQRGGAQTALVAPPLPTDRDDGAYGAHHDETACSMCSTAARSAPSSRVAACGRSPSSKQGRQTRSSGGTGS